MKLWLTTLVTTALIGAVAPTWAQDRADMDRTRITGNRELPKVLYIVPWKKPMAGDLSGRPLVSVLDEALAPLDRDVVRREVRYEALTRATARAAQVVTQPAAHPTASTPPTQ